MSTVKSFVRQFVKAVQGDDASAKAEKAFRQASSALKSQVSSLEGDTINLEDRVTEAKESQENARINGEEAITNRNAYVEGLISSKNKVVEAQKVLKQHLEKIEFLKSELASLEEQVEA